MAQTTNTVPITVYASYGTSRNSQTQRSRWQNQPQLNAVAAGGFIFLSAGMNMAQGVGWDHDSLYGYVDHFKFSWFVGVIIGAILSAPLSNLIPNKFMMAFSSLLILTEGIIFTSAPYQYDALLAARYLNGIAVGFATIPCLINASEIAVNSNRGSCLAVEQYAFSFGIAIQVIYSSQWGTTVFPANRLHGIIDIVFAIGVVSGLACLIESPIYFIRKGDEAAAMDCLSRLRRPQGVTAATTAQLEELNNYVRENENYTLVESITRGLLPLFKMIFVRSMMVAFCFSWPLNTAFQYSILANYTTWPPIVSACLRVFGGFIALALVDNLGRKLPSLFCTVILGGLIIAIGSIIGNYSLFDSYDMSIVTSLSILTQFFAGFFVPFTSVYMGEAFPLMAKPYFIAICVIIEQLIHIIIICTLRIPYASRIYDCLLTQGIIIVVVFLLMCVMLPETRRTTLKEAENRFRHLLQLKVY